MHEKKNSFHGSLTGKTEKPDESFNQSQLAFALCLQNLKYCRKFPRETDY